MFAKCSSFHRSNLWTYEHDIMSHRSANLLSSFLDDNEFQHWITILWCWSFFWLCLQIHSPLALRWEKRDLQQSYPSLIRVRSDKRKQSKTNTLGNLLSFSLTLVWHIGGWWFLTYLLLLRHTSVKESRKECQPRAEVDFLQ